VRVHRAGQVADECLEYSSPPPCEDASTIARSAVISSVTSPNASSFSGVAGLGAALLDTSCVSTIVTCLTARPRSLPGLLPTSDRRTVSPHVRLDAHFIHF